MFGYRSKNQEVEKLLRQRVDFQFDQKGVKNRLMTSIELQPARRVSFQTKSWRWKTAVGASFAVVALSMSTLTYADSSKPGDKLYFLDQWQENISLKLPRNQESRANLKSKIINERLQEIKKLNSTNASMHNLRLQTIQMTQQNIIDTVDETTRIKQNLRARGKDKSAIKVNNVLSELENLAQQQENEIELINKTTRDEQEHYRYQNNLEEIKKARMKARLERETLPF